MRDFQLYSPPEMRELQRNKSNEISILLAAVSSFIASMFANLATNDTGFLSGLPVVANFFIFIGVFIAIYLFLVFLWNRYIRTRFFHYRLLSKYEICAMVNDVIAENVICMLRTIEEPVNKHTYKLVRQKNLMNCDLIIEFLLKNVPAGMLKDKKRVGLAYVTISRALICEILLGLQKIVNKETEDDASKKPRESTSSSGVTCVSDSSKKSSEFSEDLVSNLNELFKQYKIECKD